MNLNYVQTSSVDRQEGRSGRTFQTMITEVFGLGKKKHRPDMHNVGVGVGKNVGGCSCWNQIVVCIFPSHLFFSQSVRGMSFAVYFLSTQPGIASFLQSGLCFQAH